MNQGIFITFEGADGTGKTTQLASIARLLRQKGHDVVCTREPGGTKAAEKIRSLVLDAELAMGHRTEALLYLAGRADHVSELISPALESGKIVLCDRFTDSTIVYQGCGRGIPLLALRMLDDFATGGLKPGLTILLDGDPAELAVRRQGRGVSDKFEMEGLEFQAKIRGAFLKLAASEPERIAVIDALQAETDVTEEIMTKIEALLCK